MFLSYICYTLKVQVKYVQWLTGGPFPPLTPASPGWPGSPFTMQEYKHLQPIKLIIRIKIVLMWYFRALGNGIKLCLYC